MLNDLIARLEASSKGSRELDEAIAFALGWTAENDPELYAHPSPSDSVPRYWTDPAGYGAGHGGPPAYTTSIDAALTLVPVGYVRLERYSDGWCVFVRDRARLGGHEASLQQPSAALALCIVALKTRAV